MKRRHLLLNILQLSIMMNVFVACSDNISSSQSESVISSSNSNTPNTSSSQETSPNVIKKGSKTLFIYMCGSNLESKQGSASKNIDELLSAEVDDNTQIVIQTGGSKL